MVCGAVVLPCLSGAEVVVGRPWWWRAASEWSRWEDVVAVVVVVAVVAAVVVVVVVVAPLPMYPNKQMTIY